MLRAERAAGVSAGRQCAYLQVTRSQTRMSEKQAQGLPARVATGTGDSHLMVMQSLCTTMQINSPTCRALQIPLHT